MNKLILLILTLLISNISFAANDNLIFVVRNIHIKTTIDGKFVDIPKDRTLNELGWETIQKTPSSEKRYIFNDNMVYSYEKTFIKSFGDNLLFTVEMLSKDRFEVCIIFDINDGEVESISCTSAILNLPFSISLKANDEITGGWKFNSSFTGQIKVFN